MFEQYTEKARRVIFFARYEASQFGAAKIEPEHLLLGLLREDKVLAQRFFGSHEAVEAVRTAVESHWGEGRIDGADEAGLRIGHLRLPVSTSVDLPLSTGTKRVLAHAAQEASIVNQKRVGTLHLFAGLLREEDGIAAEILRERGLRLAAVRDELARSSGEGALGAG